VKYDERLRTELIKLRKKEIKVTPPARLTSTSRQMAVNLSRLVIAKPKNCQPRRPFFLFSLKLLAMNEGAKRT
jgi:hypothetical protein